MHAEGSSQTAGRQDACRGESARRLAGRMHAEGRVPDGRQAGCMQSGECQTAGRQDACRGESARRQAGRMHAEWRVPDGRQAGCMQRGVARRQAGRMHAEGSGQTAGRQDACRLHLGVASRQAGGRQQTVGRKAAILRNCTVNFDMGKNKYILLFKYQCTPIRNFKFVIYQLKLFN
jgi:hypothetical protein